MTSYIEYGVTLTDGQKSKLISAIRNKSPLTLRLKHSHLRGSDELMLSRRQISKIKKSLANGAGPDIKISKTQIRSWWKLIFITRISWSKSTTICNKRNFKSCSCISNWCCNCTWRTWKK